MHSYVTKLRNQYMNIYEQNDAAHRIDHIDEVYQNAIQINSVLKLGLDTGFIAIVVYVHDLFAVHRHNHHELAAAHLLTTNEWYMTGISEHQRRILAAAVREHRASYTGAYTSILSEVLASADKGAPTNLLAMIERSFNYGRTKLALNPTDATIHAFKHMHEKFGRNGYAKYPAIYHAMYKTGLGKLWDKIDHLSIPSEKDVLTSVSISSLLKEMLA